MFGHTAHEHDLITTDEVAFVEKKICVGSAVVFRYDGVRLTGQVNRVQKRVTVLVRDTLRTPHDDSREFSDGQFYRKFYIPVSECTLLPSSSKGVKKK